MQLAKKIRYRSRLLLVLALLAPCLGIISLDASSLPFVTEDQTQVVPLSGTKLSSVTYEVDKRMLPQGALFSVMPVTKNVELNSKIKDYITAQIHIFSALPATQQPAGFVPQLTITPFLDYIADDAYSISMQTELYKTNQDVDVRTVSWVGDQTTAKQVLITSELADYISGVLPKQGNLLKQKIGQALSFGVLPDKRIRFYNDTEPYTNYIKDMQISGASPLNNIVDAYFYKQYPTSLTGGQKKSLQKSYEAFVTKQQTKQNCRYQKCIALTFDDGPSPDITPKVLGILKKRQAKATFFELGIQAERHPDITASVLAQGNEIQNHSYNHPDFIKLKNPKAIKEQVDKTDAILRQLGANPTMVRPPYGSYTLPIQAALNKPFILWNVDAQEWRSSTTPEKIIQQINARARQNAIVLMHDTRDQTQLHLDEIIVNLQQRGYKLVTISELLQGGVQQNGRYYSGQ